MNTKEEVLQRCTVEGTIVKLPAVQLDRKLYMDVAKSLELIGGKWKGGKIAGFVFPQDPSELLLQISNGEKRNLKKEFQFFETPDDIADWLVNLACIKKGNTILEPSAGQGAIINAIHRVLPEVQVDCCELMDINRTFLGKIDNCAILTEDFMEFEPVNGKYDRIIANPPFSKNQDILHIRQMYNCLKPGGRLVSVASPHWVVSDNLTERTFHQWLLDIGAEIHEIEKGAFKESGTMIGAVVVVIDKK